MNDFFIKTWTANIKRILPSLKKLYIFKIKSSLQYSLTIVWENDSDTIYTRLVFQTLERINLTVISERLDKDNLLYEEIFSRNLANYLFLLEQLRFKFYLSNEGFITTNGDVFYDLIVKNEPTYPKHINGFAAELYRNVMSIDIHNAYEQHPQNQCFILNNNQLKCKYE